MLCATAVRVSLFCMPGIAFANPWIPAHGVGVVKPMVRMFSGNTAYPASGFTTSTIPASSESATQLRVTGVAGIGGGFSLEYDLRAGRQRVDRIRHRQSVSQTASGLEDQEIGLNYGLTQGKEFADSITLNAIIPTGSRTSVPALGTGHFSIEPNYQVGVARGRFSGTMALGTRVFTDNGVTQFRGTLYASARVLPRISLFGTAFASRTTQSASGLPLTDQSEVYNIVRLGAGADYRITPALRPFVKYEQTIAGQAVHAGERIALGVSIRY